MWKEILVRATNESFIKMIRDDIQTVTTGIAYSEDIPENVRTAKPGTGETNLNRYLLADAKLLALSYGVEISEPVEFL